MGYRQLDHTADLGYELEAGSLPELLAEAARAFCDTITDVSRVRPLERREIRLRAEAPDVLLVDWLGELLYRFDAERLVFCTAEIAIERDGSAYALVAEVRGQPFVRGELPEKVEVKAITYHELSVREEPDGRWTARVIFDI